MRLAITVALAAVAVLCHSKVVEQTLGPDSPLYDSKTGTVNVPLDSEQSHELLDKWVDQALSGMMAALVSRRLSDVEEEDRDELSRCSRSANSVHEHAKCVVKVLDAGKQSKKLIPALETSFVQDDAVENFNNDIIENSEHELEWIGGFGRARAKRDTNRIARNSSKIKIVNRSSYELKSPDDASIFGQVGRMLTKTVRTIKNRDGKKSWRQTLEDVRREAKEETEDKKKREELRKKLRHFIDNTPAKLEDPRKRTLLDKIEHDEAVAARMEAEAKAKKEEVRVPLKIFREAVKLGLSMAGQNVSDFEQKTIKAISPRFMSVVPEDEDDNLVNLLSPSLFSIHDEGEGIEKLTSLPSILKKLENDDQEAWMDFIIEASGVGDAVESVAEKRRERKRKEERGARGEPLYFNKKNVSDIFGSSETEKIEVFEELDKSYTKEQKDNLDKMGFSVMSTEQLEKLYGKGSPYADPKLLEKFKKMVETKDGIYGMIEENIRALAKVDGKAMRDLAHPTRHKRANIVLSPFLLTWLVFVGPVLSNTFVVLSPLVLSPIILSPAVLGPIILSPWVFVPLVLSPRVLAPLILSPLIFSPLILSPLVLHPLILVPGIFNPIILTPLVLSPLILSPQVFTPLILSPMVLNPLILSPMVGSPLVLSPFVLSPLILSPQALFAVVLSPYALSPLVESKLIAAEVVLSPSWLS